MARPSYHTAQKVAADVQAAAAPMVGKQSNGVIASSSVFKSTRKRNPETDRNQIAQGWQIEAYRQMNICGEARYAVTLFAAIAARAEIGVSEPNALGRKAVWVDSGAEVDALKEIAPTVRDRARLIRDYMLHYVIAGECYLIARDRTDIDPDFGSKAPIWEIVAVTELRRLGDDWEVRLDNGNWQTLKTGDPVIRMWNPDPNDRREAWSPIRSLLPTLKEIEWLTAHIFRQVRSRLMSAGVWFLPDNLTFPAPPADSVEGGAETIATLNEAEQFMLSLAASGMAELDPEEVAFPTVVMADPSAVAQIDQKQLIQFWSEIDDKAMLLRSDAVRRFALGMDLPPEQVLGSSGLAVTGAGGSAGSVNHWGVWANEEQTISAHIEPALDTFVGTLTASFLRNAVDGTQYVIGYDTATLRLRQDRSKEAIELYDRGLLKGEVTLREVGFDPDNDRMDDDEKKMWLLNRIVGGSASPEQIQAALTLLGVTLPLTPSPAPGSGQAEGKALPGRSQPPSLEDHPYEGPPREQHDHTPAPFALNSPEIVAASEVLVLRALEKAGNRLLNDGKRGRDRDRSTPLHLVHMAVASESTFGASDFDLGLASTVFGDLPAVQRARIEGRLAGFCENLYANRAPYTRDGLREALS